MMDLTAKITYVEFFPLGGDVNIRVALSGIPPYRKEELLSYLGDVNISINHIRPKRSLDANAYYWRLVTKLAEKLRISKPRCHNEILRKYGRRELIDGMAIRTSIPDTEEAFNTALESQTYHIRPTSQTMTGKDETTYRTYVMLKGSSQYDSQEMSALIDGLIEDCKEMG